MNPSLEKILTSPRFFGLTTATPVQRAKCRIVSGAPLGELAAHPDVIGMLGGAVYTYEGAPPREVLDISASRVAKSLFAAALLVWLSQSVDVSPASLGDIIRLHVAALSIPGTRAIMTHLVNHLVAKPALRSLLVGDPDKITVTGVSLRHPSGRVIEVEPVPIDRAGGSALSVYSAGVVIDEAPRMVGAEDGVKNLDHFRDALGGRLLPGALELDTGSPWQPYGPIYDRVIEHWGKPTRELVVLRTSGPVANPSWWTPERCADLEKRKPVAYRTDCLAEFADGESTVFPSVAIDEAFASQRSSDATFGRPALFADPSALRHDFWAVMCAGWVFPLVSDEDLYECQQLGDDLSSTPYAPGPVLGGRNGWIRVLVDEIGNPIARKDGTAAKPYLQVFETVSWDKNSGARGTDLVKAVGRFGRRYGAEDFHWDGYEQLMLGDLVRNEGLRPHVHSWSGTNRKTEAVDHLRTLFIERRVVLARHDMLKQELLRYRARATAGGTFSYVVSGGAGHGDHASCLLLASRADLDGFVDGSPTRTTGRSRHVIYDNDQDNNEAA